MRLFRDRTTPEALARDHCISRATAYRYVDEVITVLAEQARGLRGYWNEHKMKAFPM